MQGIKAVVFDLDDTLIDWQATERAAMQRICDTHLPQHDAENVHAVYGAIKKENFDAFLQHGRWSYVADRLATLVERLEAPADPALLVETFTGWIRERLALLPGVDGLLEVSRQGRRTAILTNGPSTVQRPKVDRLQLEPLVDHVAIAGEMDLWKPDVRAFHAVLDRLGADPQDTLMVGDSLHFDIRPARSLGMRTCWIGGDDPAQADIVLPRAADLAPLFAASVAKSS